MKIRERHIVIMAGGIGSRFWPISTPELPKQFIDVMGIGKTLLQLTVGRFSPLTDIRNIWIVTSEKYVKIVREQLPDLPQDNILAEPEARNTAPCIAYACWKISKRCQNANIVVTPSDAMVVDLSEFRQVVSKALDFTEINNNIVTIGISPSRPETGYGYINCTNEIKRNQIVKINAFKEKPDLATAEKYLKEGNYLWNAGIFVWNMDTILKAFKDFVPQIAEIMNRMLPDFYTPREYSTLKLLFPKCEKVSIDYAIMEKSHCIYTISADFGWNDLGTWGALHKLLPNDSQRNVVVGKEVRLINCNNCLIHTNQERKVILEGLDGYIVVEHGSQLLICRLSQEQSIKDFVS